LGRLRHNTGTIEVSGTGLSLVTSIGPTLGIPIPEFIRWPLFGAGVLMVLGPTILAIWRGVKKTGSMISLAGMIVSALALIGFTAWHFWPSLAEILSSEKSETETLRGIFEVDSPLTLGNNTNTTIRLIATNDLKKDIVIDKVRVVQIEYFDNSPAAGAGNATAAFEELAPMFNMDFALVNNITFFRNQAGDKFYHLIGNYPFNKAATRGML
jgi:hypothetical protein